MWRRSFRHKATQVNLETGEITLVYLDKKGNSHCYSFPRLFAEELLDRLPLGMNKYNIFKEAQRK